MLADTGGAPAAPAQEQAGDDTVREYSKLGVDPWGALLMGTSLLAVALLWAYCALRKRLEGRGRMESCAAGQLRLAAARGRVADLELLSKLESFQVDADLAGFTALHAAAVQGHAAAVAWLLDHGADPTKMKQDGWRDTAMHYAAGSGSLQTVQALLAFGADAGAVNAMGATPADVAAKAGHAEVAAFLRKAAGGLISQPSRDLFVKLATWVLDAPKSSTHKRALTADSSTNSGGDNSARGGGGGGKDEAAADGAAADVAAADLAAARKLAQRGL